jgi:endo-1,4-beta-xylanase
MRFTLDASTRKTRRAATAPLRSSLLVWLAMMLPACSAGTDDQQAMPSEGGDGSGGAATGGILPGTGGSTAGSGGTASGGSATGGSATGGSATGGGSAAGGSSTGGVSTGGAEPGGAPTGGDNGGTPSPGVKFVGNITTGWNGALDTNGLTYSDYWDQVTPENAGKWGSVQGSPTSGFNWGTLDSIHDYTQRAGIVFKQHTFIWGAQQPEPQSSITETHVKTWMQEFCKRYPDTAVIDVVNEPPPHTNPGYANNIGGGTNGDWKWIANAFKWAREACPNAILILNDYNDIEWTNDNQHMIDIVKAIQAQDAPIDAIGCQAHDLDHSGVSSSNVKSMATKLHDQTGLPLYITEMDISTTDDAAQLRMYQDYMPFFLETEWIHGITIWGWIFGSTWSLAPDSGLVRNGSSRPAMTWLMEQLDRPSP